MTDIHASNVQDAASAFEGFDLASGDPKWSSRLLDRLFERVLGEPQSTMTGLLRGFDLALARHEARLTESVAALINDVVVTAFTRYRHLYDQAEWEWANDALARGTTAARAYFFLHALPPDQAAPESLLSILRALEGTSRFDEAVSTLSEEIDQSAVKQELRKWRTNGMGTQAEARLHAFF